MRSTSGAGTTRLPTKLQGTLNLTRNTDTANISTSRSHCASICSFETQLRRDCSYRQLSNIGAVDIASVNPDSHQSSPLPSLLARLPQVRQYGDVSRPSPRTTRLGPGLWFALVGSPVFGGHCISARSSAVGQMGTAGEQRPGSQSHQYCLFTLPLGGRLLM